LHEDWENANGCPSLPTVNIIVSRNAFQKQVPLQTPQRRYQKFLVKVW